MLKIMTPEDEKLSYYLHKQLDDETVSQEIKIDIIKWFDQFDYIENMKVLDIILLHAERLNW